MSNILSIVILIRIYTYQMHMYIYILTTIMEETICQ